MTPKLYMIDGSPAVRTVLMVAKAINLELEKIPVDMSNGDHLKPEFLKMNPTHTVPVLVDDDGFVIWDSHTIVVYLINKYAPDSSLLPKDIKQRALVDLGLHVDSGILFPRFTKIGVIDKIFRLHDSDRSILLQGKTTIEEEDKNSLREAYGFLENLLENSQWIAGDALTVADFSMISTMSSSNVLVPIDSAKLPKVTAWMKKMEELEAYGANRKGLEMFRELFKHVL